MLQRSKNGVFSIAANLFGPSNFLYFSYSSNQNSRFGSPSRPSRKPKTSFKSKPKSSLVHPQITPLTGTDERRFKPKSIFSKISEDSSSDVVSICSLLFDSSAGSRDLDILLREFKDKLSSDLVLLVLMHYRYLGRVNTLEFFSWAGSHLGFCFDDSVVEYMADFLGRRKLFDDLKCLLKTASSTRGKVSCRAISIGIRFLGRQGRIKDALCLFEEMESEFNCKPDNLVFNNMLYVLCKKESTGEFIDLALVIFHRMESPDTYSYSNILVGLCKFGRLESALDVFYGMGRADLVPTRSAINILIGELCGASANEERISKVKVINFRRPFNILVPNVSSKGLSIQPATQVFWAMLGWGLLPSAFVINRLISELCRLRKIGEAIDILKVIDDRKMRCVEESFTIVIRALCDIGIVDGACQLFGRMLSQGLKPKLIVYNSIICLLCKLGNVEEADRVFEIMTKRRCTPDNVTYTALIHGYVGVHKWESAYELLMEMLGMGWCPHCHTYRLVYTLLKEQGRADLSLKLESKLETQLLHKQCKAGQLEAAYERLRSMLEKGFYLPMYTRSAFERAFQKAGKWKIARELLERMDTGNSEVTTMMAEEMR